MRCKPWRWLWGFLPLALVAFVATISQRGDVQTDLKVRSEAALRNAGLDWARLTFEGRDGVISGKALDENERKRASEIVGKIHGVRIVRDDAQILAHAKPYVWTALREKRRVTITGHVGSEADRGSVVAMARKQFPGFEIDDRMTLARGAPSKDVWMSGIRFGLRQLRGLRQGRIVLSDTTISISGDASSSNMYGSVRQAIATELPQGFALGKDDVRPPLIAPYRWSFELDAERLVLNGFVPDNGVRNRILNRLKAVHPNLEVEDRLAIGAGAPAGFEDAALASIEQTSSLERATVVLTDKQIDVSGMAADEETANEVRASLEKRLSSRFKIKNAVLFHKPKPPLVRPFTWSAEWRGEQLVLRGHVATEDGRKKVVRAAREFYPNAKIVDEMRIARGAPAEDSWLAGLRVGLEELARLKSGRIAMRDQSLSLEGEAGDEQAYRRVRQSLAKSKAEGLKIASVRLKPPLADPFVWSAKADDARVTLSGHVPDEAVRRQLIAHAKQQFPGREIRDDMRVASGAPDPTETWLTAARGAIASLGQLGNGTVRLRNRNFHITGRTSDADKVRAAGIAAGGLPAGYEGAANVELIPEPEPDISWQATRDSKRLVMSGQVINEAIRSALVAEARNLFPDLNIVDEMTVAERQSDSARWSTSARRSLNLLSRLTEGRAELKGTELIIAGKATSKADVDLIRETVTAALPDGYRGQEAVEFIPPKPKANAEEVQKKREDLTRKQVEEAERKEEEARIAAEERRLAKRKEYRLISEYNGGAISDADPEKFSGDGAKSRGKLILRGKVANEAARKALIASGQNLYDVPVVDQLTLLDGAPDADWLDASIEGLTQLSRLRTGALSVTHDKLALFGDAPSNDAARSVREMIDSETPERYDVRFRITAPRKLKAKEVKAALKSKAPVEAEVCGNIMNSLTQLAPIRFDIASARIRKDAIATLEKLAQAANKCTKTRIRVFGHTDSDGRRSYNQKLSKRRARAVAQYLKKKGIAESRLTVRGFGETQPLVRNTSRSRRAKNRRIEFIVTKN